LDKVEAIKNPSIVPAMILMWIRSRK